MRNIIILLVLNLMGVCFGQIPDSKSQLKISYFMKYEKVPFQMKLFKKYLPTELVEYHSRHGLRNEVKFDAKILGKDILNNTIAVDNDSLSKSWIKTQTIINDSIVDSEFIESQYISEEQNILIGDQRKNILGYDCINFVFEDDSTKTEGFLSPEIIVTGDFQKYGLPLESTTTSKTEKLVVTTKANEIILEPLDASMFILTKD